MRKHLIWVLVILLLPALACGFFGGDDDGDQADMQADLEAAATEVVVEAESAIEEAAEAGESAAQEMEEAADDASSDDDDASSDSGASSSGEFATGAGLNDLASYRVSFIMEFEGESGGEVNKGRIEVVTESTENPPATHLKMKMEGSTVEEMGGVNEMEIYNVDNTVYMKNAMMGDGWISFSGDDADAFEEGFFAPDEQLEMPKTANCSGVETVNGVEAKHCTFDANDIEEQGVTFESLEGDVWVAVDGDYIVKYVMKATGYQSTNTDEEDLFGFGDVSFEYNLTDANGDFTITVPEDAQNAGGIDLGGMVDDATGGDDGDGVAADAGDIPVMDDAEEMMSMGGFVSYSTAAGVSDVTDFYRSEFSGMGWAENSDQSYADDTTAFVTFEKDGSSLMVTATAEDGRTSVIVASLDQ